MLTKSFDFHVPQGWHELDDRQLRYVYRLLSLNFSSEEIQLLCLLRWSNVKVVGRQPSGAFLLKHKGDFFEVTPTAIAELLPNISWLAELPTSPIRPERIHKSRAIPATLSGSPFELYLAVENLYQGFMQTQSDEMLDALGQLLYPKVKSPLAPHDRIAVFYWVAALKEFFARRYPDFFQPSAGSDNLLGEQTPNVEAAMNAQIRALTKGDVTKEREILALDTWRALAELDAQAREYKELNSKLHANK